MQKHYRNLIDKERSSFLEYSKRYFQQALNDDYEYVNETIVQYINEMMDYLKSWPINNYKQYFIKIDEF